MIVQKKPIGTLEKCYSLAPLQYKGRKHFLAASEQKNKCLLFDEDGNKVDTIWENPGGTMTMCQVPDGDGIFLAVHQFYSPDDSKSAKIVSVMPDGEGQWKVRTLVELPHVHRFDILEQNGVQYLLICTLKSGHEHQGDWSMPGKVYAAVLPENLEDYHDKHQLELTVLKENLLRNHGYTRTVRDGVVTGVVSCQSGVYCFCPPKSREGRWQITQILQTPASDAVFADLNGDGKAELAVISPFHGALISIYEEKEGGYEKVYEYEKKAPFSHSIFGGPFCGKDRVVIGHREGERNLLCFSWNETQGYHWQLLDSGRGSANVLKVTKDEKDVIISTNRESDEIAMYICSSE